MQRITRTDLTSLSFEPSSRVDAQAFVDDFQRLRKLLSGRVTAPTFSIFSEPRPGGANKVDWTTSLGGQPTPIDSLPVTEATQAGKILNDRLENVLKIADEMGPSALEDAAFLRRSARYKDRGSVYVLNGEPVLVEWGGDVPEGSASGVAPSVAAAAAEAAQAQEEEALRLAAEKAAKKQRMKQTMGRVGVLSLAAAAAAAALIWWFFIRVSLYDQLVERFENASCEELAELKERPAIKSPKNDRFAELGMKIDDKSEECLLADLKRQVADAKGDCVRLKEIVDHERLQSPSEAAFTAIRKDLDRQLLDCSFQELSELVQNGACSEVDALLKSEPLLGENGEGRFRNLRITATAKIASCRYEDVKLAVDEAEGNCQITRELLDGELLLKEPPEPRYEELRNRVDTTLRDCVYSELKKRVEEADCEVAQELLSNEPLMNAIEERFAALKQSAEEKIADCAFDGFKEEMEAAAADCDLAADKLKTEPKLQIEEDRYQELRAMLEQALVTCRDKRLEEARNQCSGERPPEFAPQFAMVFDASGSMNEYLTSTSANGMPVISGQRIQAARQAASGVVGNLPSDVDAGLVVISRCQPNNLGNFSAQNRNKLLGLINQIQPFGRTPLAQGVAEAGKLLDGVERDALMVIISDGEESCLSQPEVCAVGRRLAKTKPRLKINVVDINAVGAATCLARATGGRVFPARSAREVAATMESAAADALGPARCRNQGE